MEHPTIKLAGQDYPVKPLVVKQLRIVVPAMLRLRNASMSAVTEAQFDDLVEIAFQAVKSSQPELTREAFSELPIGGLELMASIDVIAKQAGMVSGEPASGEATAGNQTST